MQLTPFSRTSPGRLVALLIGLAALGAASRFPYRKTDRPDTPVPTVALPFPASGPRSAPAGVRLVATSPPARVPLPTTIHDPAALSSGSGRPPAGSHGHTPAAWPPGPVPLPGAILPTHRIVAYYGNPYSKRMGVLGELPPDSMMASLRQTAADWASADSTVPVKPALHLIVSVAQGKAGRDGKHRLRMPESLIEQVAGWAEANDWLLFLDVQVGHSTVAAELPRLLPYLARPYVHLALDPEFAMKDGSAPGRRIGTMDAVEVNVAVHTLSGLVDSLHLPPKVLVVHRFTQRMLTNYDRITLDPRVQVVIDMDGFGGRPLKRSVYRDFIVKEPVQFTGFKLFFKNDRPMMTPDEVLSLSPVPVYIQYQ